MGKEDEISDKPESITTKGSTNTTSTDTRVIGFYPSYLPNSSTGTDASNGEDPPAYSSLFPTNKSPNLNVNPSLNKNLSHDRPGGSRQVDIIPPHSIDESSVVRFLPSAPSDSDIMTEKPPKSSEKTPLAPSINKTDNNIKFTPKERQLLKDALSRMEMNSCIKIPSGYEEYVAAREQVENICRAVGSEMTEDERKEIGQKVQEIYDKRYEWLNNGAKQRIGSQDEEQIRNKDVEIKKSKTSKSAMIMKIIIMICTFLFWIPIMQDTSLYSLFILVSTSITSLFLIYYICVVDPDKICCIMDTVFCFIVWGIHFAHAPKSFNEDNSGNEYPIPTFILELCLGFLYFIDAWYRMIQLLSGCSGSNFSCINGSTSDTTYSSHHYSRRYNNFRYVSNNCHHQSNDIQPIEIPEGVNYFCDSDNIRQRLPELFNHDLTSDNSQTVESPGTVDYDCPSDNYQTIEESGGDDYTPPDD